MLSPIVIPVPLALVFVALLGVVFWAANRFLRAADFNPWAGQTWATTSGAPAATGGRHRPENIAHPIDWADVMASRLVHQHAAYVADYRQPLTDFERRMGVLEIEGAASEPCSDMGSGLMLAVAGLPDRVPVVPGPLHVTGDIAVVSTHPEPCGFPDVVPCICALVADEDTRELTTVA